MRFNVAYKQRVEEYSEDGRRAEMEIPKDLQARHESAYPFEAQLIERIAKAEAERDQLRAQLATATTELDRLREENGRMRAPVSDENDGLANFRSFAGITFRQLYADEIAARLAAPVTEETGGTKC